MPLQRPEDHGTDANGRPVDNYCRHCFVNGAFVNPAMTMSEMLETCVTMMAQRGIMPAAEARTLMARTLPQLKRWRSTAST
jgi:hypothetical protein